MNSQMLMDEGGAPVASAEVIGQVWNHLGGAGGEKLETSKNRNPKKQHDSNGNEYRNKSKKSMFAFVGDRPCLILIS
jgi:hypothetical protein